MAKKNDDLTPPKEDFYDKLNSVTEVAFSVGVSSTDPTLGLLSAGVLALFKILTPTYGKRLYRWMNDVVDKIKELEEEIDDFKSKNLANNALFLSAFQISSRIAVQTHQEEKLQVLRNAMLNTVVMKDVEENFKLLFFTYIESMTVVHIDIMKFFRKLREGFGALDRVYQDHYELYLQERSNDIGIDELLFTSLCKDLENKGLLIHGKKIGTKSGARKDAVGQFEWIRHTELGEKFYRFILEPQT